MSLLRRTSRTNSSVYFFRPKKNARASSLNDASRGHGFSRSMAAEGGVGLATLIEVDSQSARRGAPSPQSKPRNDSMQRLGSSLRPL